MYENYVRNCKFAQQQGAAKWITFMRRTMSELYGLDEPLAYRHGFIYIRQLAIHLRNATNVLKKVTWDVKVLRGA
jgi:nucleolar complex protein 2